VPKKQIPSGDEAALKTRFGAAVRRYRQRLAISQEELAWRAEMHRTYLADVERGARNLSLSSIARLVGAIGVSMSAFFATFESVEVPGEHHRPAKAKAKAGKTGASAARRRR
jgi:transcriptional regulator with XRE-family HTH domain